MDKKNAASSRELYGRKLKSSYSDKCFAVLSFVDHVNPFSWARAAMGGADLGHWRDRDRP